MELTPDKPEIPAGLPDPIAEPDIEIELGGDTVEIDDGVVSKEQPAPKPEHEESALGGEEDDKKKYSKAVRERIAREEKLKWEERDRADAAEVKARQLEADIAKLQKEHEELAGKNVDHDIAVAEAEWRKARVDADDEQELAAQRKIARLTALKERGPVRVERADPAPTAPPRNPHTDSWKARNDWFEKPGYEAQTAAAKEIDRSMAVKGLRPTSADYFNRLDAELVKTVIIPRRRTVDDGEQPRQMVAGAGDSPASGGSKTKVKITPEDRANIRRFGGDDTDPNVLKEYAQQKLKLAAAEGAR